MKKSVIIASASICAVFAAGVVAQTLDIQLPTMKVRVDADTVGPMTYSGGTTLTVEQNTFNLSEVSGMTVTNEEYKDNEVQIVYDGNSVDVTVAQNIYPYITVKADGAHLTITQSGEVGDATGEITYILKGSSDNGSFTFNGSYKSTIELQGLTLTNPGGIAIDIENGKRIEFSSKNGTVNTITDGKDGKQKAAIYCKGHLELKGKGTLNVTGNTGHAIQAKEYVEMKNCTVNIQGAPKDGINCTQYFLMESGTLEISGIEGDGIQVDFDESDASKREKEDTGSVTIKDGTLTMELTGPAAKGFKTEGNIIVNGGEITITNSGPGEWDSSKLKTKAASCFGADGEITISGGKMTLSASGGGGKGMSCDGDFTMTAGDVNITTTGGALVWNGTTLSQNYTGDLERIDSDKKSSPKGIKSEGDVVIKGGTIYVKTQGNNGEGIESKETLTIEGGDITVRAKDDAINSSSHMYIKGGNIDVIATNNDGLDANGNIYIQGGVIRAFGAKSPECGIDANEERGYTVIITGGYLLACGGSNSVPSSSSGSSQPYVTTTSAGTLTGGNTISISNGSDTLYTFTIPTDYTSSTSGSGPGGGPGGWGGGSSGGTVMISTPDMVDNTTYTIKNGSTTTTATSRLTGGGNNGRPF